MKEEIIKSIVFYEADIVDKRELRKLRIDTIVNAANPTLMGSSRGVDGAIHKTIDRSFKSQGKKSCFKNKICEELGTGEEKNLIRCQRGEAVITSGHNLCKYVIHVVGAKYDGNQGLIRDCSSSAVHILESCYYNIVKRIKEHPDIKNVAIPIISSGEYGFPFHTATEIAVASVYNAIVEWKAKDSELFEMSGLEKIYFFVYDRNKEKQEKHLQTGNRILDKYRPVMLKEKRIVFQSSIRAHFRYCKEIMEYDRMRGYFSIARQIRLLLMLLRIAFFPGMILKDLWGGRNWEKRRWFVESFAVFKVFIPIIFYLLVTNGVTGGNSFLEDGVFPTLIIYNISDTITYLLVLIVLADIQRPSANIIRSMIMLFVNYIEVSLGVAYLYFILRDKMISLHEMITVGILGIGEDAVLVTVQDYMLSLADSGTKFFFITLAFGYFANHMHQRKFRV